MPFEQILRDHLLDDAEVVALPDRGDPGRAVTRARARRRHRLTGAAVAAVAVVGAAAVAAVPALRDDGGETVVSPAARELEPTGPLDLAWSSTDDGLSGVESQFQGADGTVYALATGPGVRYGDDLPFTKALYRLDENGVWQPLVLDDGHRMEDIAGVDDTLYGVSTGPAAQGEGTVLRLSRSGDGGETWTDEDIPPADAPSAGHDWRRSVTMQVESNGTVTLALVNTQFFPDPAALFPEMADLNAGYRVEPRDEGLVLVRSGGEMWVAPTSTVVAREAPNDTATVQAESGDPEVRDGTATPDEDIRTIPWSDLGVAGEDEAYAKSNQVFRLSGDSWEPVDNDLGDLVVVDFGLAGDLFTASSIEIGSSDGPPDGSGRIYVSADGASWTQVEAPGDGHLVGSGPGLVDTSNDGTIVNVSADGGATWSPSDLAGAGMAPDGHVIGASGGPLGVALVIGDAGGNPQALATSADLVTWTITPLSDIAGSDDIGAVSPYVGRDRIVVTINGHNPGGPLSLEPGPSRTVVGTPRRS
jgi:hypothetical protein